MSELPPRLCRCGNRARDGWPTCGLVICLTNNEYELAKPPAEIWMAVGANVKERLVEGDGIWRTCSGCYESEDGHPNGFYPHSTVFNCVLGGGCSECGGIGAIWDTTDYEVRHGRD